MQSVKAQAEAPVELVIAVIIMIMSTALAFLLINQSNEDKCLAELKTQTDVLQEAVLSVALASPPTSRTVLFRPIECGGKTIEALQFVYYSDPAFCSLCAARYGGCWQIIPVAQETQRFIPLYKSISCINMAGNVWMTQDTDCSGDVINLHEAPYPDGEDPVKWGIPTSVWSGPGDTNSRWRTFMIDKTTRAYNIKLTKSANVLPMTGEEQGLIKICVTKVA